MQILRKNQTYTHHNAPSCSVVEYPMGDADINCAVATISGRYPEHSFVTNLACKEMGYVISGSGKIVIEGKEELISEGDMVLIMPGERYYWEGTMTLLLPCTPAWTPEQHKVVE